MAFIIKNTLKLTIGKQILKVYSPINYAQQGLKTTAVQLMPPHKQNPNTKTTHNNDATNQTGQKKNKETSPKITLIQQQNITVTALEEAKNLAKRRSMHLVQIQEMDAKTQRPVYKLLTAAEMLQNELSDVKSTDKTSNNSASTANNDKLSSQKKSEKSLNIGSRITEHDLSSRLKNISKWLAKRHEVRILIQGSSDHDLANCEKIYKTIEQSIKTPEDIGKVVQKRIKGSIIKFNIIPTNTGNDKTSSGTQ